MNSDIWYIYLFSNNEKISCWFPADDFIVTCVQIQENNLNDRKNYDSEVQLW